MKTKRFRKKPVVIEAIEYTEDLKKDDLEGFIGRRLLAFGPMGFSLPTLEGPMNASPGDWIIKDVQGECYPCKPDIFAETYEPE